MRTVSSNPAAPSNSTSCLPPGQSQAAGHGHSQAVGHGHNQVSEPEASGGATDSLTGDRSAHDLEGPVTSKTVVLLRKYQQKAVDKAKSGNTIVLLPTGSGKTLVAAETITQVVRDGRRALFLVPTCLLVVQQAKAVREWTNKDVGELMGGLCVPLSFDVLVSTPKIFQQAQSAHPHLCWSNFDLVIFDEVHHVLKDHPYRHIALHLRNSEHPVRVLGLTASLSYAVTEGQVMSAVTRVCAELRIDHLETATEDELQSAGYFAKAVPATVLPVALPGGWIPAGVLEIQQRKPHLMLQQFSSRIKAGTATPFAQRLMACIQAMEEAVKQEQMSKTGATRILFSSPMDRLPPRKWGSFAKTFSASDQLSPTCTCIVSHLEHYYEAAKLLVVSWEEAEDAAAGYLQMVGVDPRQGNAHVHVQSKVGVGGIGVGVCTAVWPNTVSAVLHAFWSSLPASYPRFEHLKDTLAWKLDSISDFRGVLFVEQRAMTHVLKYIISSDTDLGPRLKIACLHASTAAATASHSVSPSQSRRNLDDFSSGAVNLLIATVVAEEGMDVPGANCVIRFDPVLNLVSFVQGRGRARQEGSSFVVLSERPDRPATMLAEVEKRQMEMFSQIKPKKLRECFSSTEITTQMSRERGALPLFLPFLESSQYSECVDLPAATSAAHEFCAKTRGSLETSFQSPGQGGAAWSCKMKYTSVLRSVAVEGNGPTKQLAKSAASLNLIKSLLSSCV